MTMKQVQVDGSGAEHQQPTGMGQRATPPPEDDDLSSNVDNEWDDDMKDAASLS